MKHIVSEQTKKKTERCENNFSCLESGTCGDNPLCAVREQTPGLLTIKIRGPITCPYLMNYGKEQFCMCPTHLAIKRQS
jgi:hypothetical protein